MATVLVVEDERKLRDFVRSYLERAGFTVLSTGSGAEAITMAAEAAPDLVVLDLGLPDVPGETVARELRSGAATPILMLTAKTSEEDRIRGLELGADDYVTKPFSPRELVLRVQAILRRGGPAAEQGVTSFGGGELVIDEPQRLVTVRGQVASLTPTEWGVLVALATVPGNPPQHPALPDAPDHRTHPGRPGRTGHPAGPAEPARGHPLAVIVVPAAQRADCSIVGAE